MTPIVDMAETARALGHEYLALTDHSPRLQVANGLSRERLEQQLDVVAELNESWNGDGAGALNGSDDDRSGDRRRVRPPSEFDAELVFVACKDDGVAVEINCRPERRDPPRALMSLALEIGCHFSIQHMTNASRTESTLSSGSGRSSPSASITSMSIPRARVCWTRALAAARMEGLGSMAITDSTEPGTWSRSKPGPRPMISNRPSARDRKPVRASATPVCSPAPAMSPYPRVNKG